MLRFLWRRRCAATLALLAVPCGVHARCGRPPDPPVRWQTFDFALLFTGLAKAEPDWEFLPIEGLVSPLIPGQFETPRQTIFEYEPGFRDTGFRGSLDSLIENEAFPSHLDGAFVDVMQATSGLGASDESLREFLSELECNAVIVGQGGLFDADSREVAIAQPSALKSPIGYLSFTRDVWQPAESPEEWFDVAEAFASAERKDASPGLLVFDPETMLPNAMPSVLPNRADALRETERAETPWPERRVVATLTVTFVRSAGCRGFSNLDPVTLRFPLAALSNDP